MPRPERPLDPAIRPLHAFAADLRRLRESAGSPKYLVMARRTGRSKTALSEAAGGDHLPSWDTVKAFVEACGGDPADWRTRWEAVREGPRSSTADPTPGGPISEETSSARRRAWWPRLQRTGRTGGLALAAVLLVGLATGATLLAHGRPPKGQAARHAGVGLEALAGESGHAATLSYSKFTTEWFISGGVGGVLTVWDTSTGLPSRQIDTHSAAVSTVAVDPFHRYRVASAGTDGHVRVWDITSGEGLQTLQLAVSSKTTQVAFDPQAIDMLAATNGNGQVEVWNVATGQMIRTFGRPGVQPVSLAFDPSTRNTLALATTDKVVDVWDTSSGKLVRHMQSPGSIDTTCLAFDPYTPKTLVAGTDRQGVIVWDSSTGRKVRDFGGSASVRSVAFNPAIPNSLIVGDAQGRVAVWDASNGVSVHMLRSEGPGVSASSFAPDGKTLAVGQDNGFIILWPIQDWK